MDLIAAAALCRFARDGAALLLWGGCLYMAALAPPVLQARLAAGFARLRRVAVAAVAAAVLALLPIEAAALGDGWPDALDPATVRAMLFETTIGTAWLAQGASAILLCAALALPDRWRDRAMAAVAALFLASLTLTGHAAMHEGWLGAAHRANHALHLLAAGFWLGALVPLLPTLAVLGEPDGRRASANALRRFSLLGHGAVALVIITGALNTALILGRWPTDWSSPYQALLAGKIGLVALMAGLALVNRYVVVPRLSKYPAAALRALRTASLVEIGLGSGALALVAVFGLLEPS